MTTAISTHWQKQNARKKNYPMDLPESDHSLFADLPHR